MGSDFSFCDTKVIRINYDNDNNFSIFGIYANRESVEITFRDVTAVRNVVNLVGNTICYIDRIEEAYVIAFMEDVEPVTIRAGAMTAHSR